MRKKVLIIRTLQQGIETQSLLDKMGIDSDILPLMDCQFLDKKQDVIDALHRNQGVIATSVNGLQVFKTIDSALFCTHHCVVVGQTTAQTAQNLGFLNISISPSGGAVGIIDLLDRDKAYLYSRAEIISVDLKNMTENEITEIITYKMLTNSNENNDIYHKLQSGFYNAVLVYSSQMAQQFLKFSPDDFKIPIFCLSPKIATVFPEYYKTYTPNHPSQQAFLQHLQNFLNSDDKKTLPFKEL